MYKVSGSNFQFDSSQTITLNMPSHTLFDGVCKKVFPHWTSTALLQGNMQLVIYFSYTMDYSQCGISVCQMDQFTLFSIQQFQRVQWKRHICIFIRPGGLLKTESQSFVEWATCCYLLYSKAANVGPQNCLHFRNAHCTHHCLNSSPIPQGLLISDLT